MPHTMETGYIAMTYSEGFSSQPTFSRAYDSVQRAERDAHFAGARCALVAKISYALPFDASDIPAFPSEIAAIKTGTADNSGWVPWESHRAR